jgi:hypothetical protein
MATTQTLSSSHILDDDFANDSVAPTTRANRTPMLRRLYNAMIESQMRRAQLELDRKLGPGTLSRLRLLDTGER